MKKRKIMSAAIAASTLILLLAGCNTGTDQKTQKSPAAATAQTRQTPVKTGEELFKQFCSTCHPDGGNVSDPGRNLHRTTLQNNHITKAEDIIRIMRRPISRMITFDQSTLSDQDARKIAEYVLSAF